MMNGIAEVRIPMNAYFLPNALNAPMADWPVLRPSAVSSSRSDTPKVNTSTK